MNMERRTDMTDGKAYTKAQFVKHNWEEKRAARDGKVYTWKEFVGHYGKEQGEAEWARAGERETQEGEREKAVSGKDKKGWEGSVAVAVLELRELVTKQGAQIADLKEENKDLQVEHKKLEAEHSWRIGELEQDVRGLRACLRLGCMRNGNSKETALHSACRDGALGVVDHLFASHDAVEWVDSTDGDGWTPAQVAARHGHVEVARAVMAQGGGSLEGVVSAAGAEGGHAETGGELLVESKELKELLKGKGEVDKAEGRTRGRTYLWLAARFGLLEAVRGLVGVGADPLVTAKDGTTAYDVAVTHGHFPVAADLVMAEAEKKGTTSCELAVQKGHLSELAEFLPQPPTGVPPPAPPTNLTTAIDVAARAGDVEALEALGGVNALTDELRGAAAPGVTPLTVALMKGYPRKTIEEVLAVEQWKGAESVPGWRSRLGTALQAKKFTVHQPNGYYPLHSAAVCGAAVIAEGLLAVGADVDVEVKGVTPLSYAAYYGHADTVKVLLAAGADKEKVSNGEKPLEWARQKGYAAVVSLLS